MCSPSPRKLGEDEPNFSIWLMFFRLGEGSTTNWWNPSLSVSYPKKNVTRFGVSNPDPRESLRIPMTSLVAAAQLAPPPATSSRPFLTRRSEGESGRTWRWGWRKSGNPGCLGYIGDNTTQLYRDYNKRFWGSLLTNQYNGK